MFGLGLFEAAYLIIVVGLTKLGIPAGLVYLAFRGYRSITGRLDRFEQELREIRKR